MYIQAALETTQTIMTQSLCTQKWEFFSLKYYEGLEYDI